MRAVVVEKFGPAEDLSVREIPEPVAGPGEILIGVQAVGVNFPDNLVVEGKYQLLPDLPFVAGKELAGTVLALGAGVSGPSVGSRVAAMVEWGAFAERVAVPAAQVFPVPDGIDLELAAGIGLVYQTAWFALHDRAGFQAGERVLVTGASGAVGQATVALVKALGGTALAGTSSASGAAVCRELGADGIVDLAAADLRESLRAQVREITGGGVDIVIDNVGGAVFGAALRALDWRGRLVVVGFASGDIPEVRANYLLVKNIAVSGLQWSDYRSRWPAEVADAQARILDLVRSGRMRPRIADIRGLEDAGRTLAEIRDRKVHGKVVLRIG